MKRICSLILCLLLLLSLTACSKEETTPAPAETAAPTPEAAATEIPAATQPPETTPAEPAESGSYADAYLRYRSIYTAVQDEVNRRLDRHNAALEEKNPTGFFMDSGYLMLVYTPFYASGPAVGSALAEPQLEAAEALMRSYWPDAVLSADGDNVWSATYSYADPPEMGGTVHQCLCTWEYDPATGSFRVIGYTDGTMTEFTEFIPQGDDVYLLYSMTDKALVTYVDGAITELHHAHMINEQPLGDFAGDVRLNALLDYDFFPGVVADKRWITEEPNAQYIITIQNDTMTYSGKYRTNVPAEDGTTTLTWADAGTITLLNP